MKLLFTEQAKKELEDLPGELSQLFLEHIEKIMGMPPRRHMKHGIPCHVENVTKQARMIYEIKGEALHILHCFQEHKEYEKWYRSYR